MHLKWESWALEHQKEKILLSELTSEAWFQWNINPLSMPPCVEPEGLEWNILYLTHGFSKLRIRIRIRWGQWSANRGKPEGRWIHKGSKFDSLKLEFGNYNNSPQSSFMFLISFSRDLWLEWEFQPIFCRIPNPYIRKLSRWYIRNTKKRQEDRCYRSHSWSLLRAIASSRWDHHSWRPTDSTAAASSSQRQETLSEQPNKAETSLGVSIHCQVLSQQLGSASRKRQVQRGIIIDVGLG